MADGDTPLHLAAQEDYSELMAALIEAGAKIDSRCWDGATRLHSAASAGHIDIVRELAPY